MKALAINCGSSSLKFKVIELAGHAEAGNVKERARGSIERIGGRGTISFVAEDGQPVQENAMTTDHAGAVRLALEWLDSSGIAFEAAGHRIVHGGRRFAGPAIVDDEVIRAIDDLRFLAPLHNEPSLRALRASRAVLGDSIPMVAVFDTAFHATMPKRASHYAIAENLASKHSVKRYGFHGLAYRYMVERYDARFRASDDQARLICLQLGNGCSAAAISGGQSIDTSMGLTPLEGLMMGTRSGNVDPHLPGFLARMERVDLDTVEDLLNRNSGLLGVSGRSHDMRELLEAEKHGDAKAALAVEMFCYRARKCIGAYLAALGGADAVIFGGGIGENSPEARARICAGMEWCGLVLDGKINSATMGTEGRITADRSKIHAYVIPVDEEVVIARDTVSCLKDFRKPSR